MTRDEKLNALLDAISELCLAIDDDPEINRAYDKLETAAFRVVHACNKFTVEAEPQSKDCHHPGCCCVCGHQGLCPEDGPAAIDFND